MRREGMLIVKVVGPFRVIGSGGEDRTPRARKACALLALLAFAPDHKRGRKWLQDKLWSDRATEQGGESLRQTLSEIRRAFGPDRDCLFSDRFTVALDRGRVDVDASPGAAGHAGAVDECILLENLDVIRDREFENWLRDQRARFDAELDSVAEFKETATKPAPDASDTATDRPPGETHPVQLQLILEPSGEAASPQDAVIANALTDIVAKTIRELGTVDVVDRRHDSAREPAPGPLSPSALVLTAGVVHDGGGATWRILLAEAAQRHVVWTATARQRNVSTLNVADPDILGQLNQVVDAAIASFISAHDARNEPGIATFLCRQGTMHLSRLGPENFSIADTLFKRAFELEPRGLYLAWRAYLRMYLMMERQFTCRQTLVEEALAFQRRALEMEPFNSYVASLSAHVHAFMRRSYVAAYEFAQRGIQLNRANPLAWAGLGMAEAHLGRTKAGMRHAVMARELAGGTPFRFQIDGLSCIASAMAGDFDRSIWYGEASHALLPNFAPPLRYLCALYACRGEAEPAQETLEKLRTLEPDFSYDMLRDKSYPAIGLHRSNLLESLPSRQI